MKAIILMILMAAAVLLPVGNGFQNNAVEAAKPAQAIRNCQNIQLLIRAQSGQGAAGHIAVIFRIHNLTGQPCTLYGYPGIQLLDRNFQSLPTTVHRGPGNLVGAIPKQPVRLGAYGNAYFALGYSDVPVNNGPCSTAYYLMIFAPNDYLPVVTYASGHGGSITACSSNLNVSPVTAVPRYQ